MNSSGPTDRRVVVLGESILDVIDDGVAPRPVPGGSAANVALGLARRGLDVLFTTNLGRDHAGGMIERHLTESGVVIDPDSYVDAGTSTAVARRRPDGDVAYEFDVRWEPRDPPPGDAAVLHLGSVAAFADADHLVETLARDRVVTFDPNIRPALLPDAARARADFRRLTGIVDVLKLSDEDAAWLLPGMSPEEVLGVLLDDGVATAVVTLGAAGLLLANRDGWTRVPGRRVDVVDTIGAGDTVMTSLIVDRVEGRLDPGGDLDGLAAAGERAVAAAAVTVARAGADLPFAHELAGD